MELLEISKLDSSLKSLKMVYPKSFLLLEIGISFGGIYYWIASSLVDDLSVGFS